MFSFFSNKNQNSNISTISNQAKIKVIGVGGGGSNAVAYMLSQNLTNVEFWAVNTDSQALDSLPSDIRKCQIGEMLTKSLGAGMRPEIGRNSAEENQADLEYILNDADMVFIAAGMGGGTGTGAAPFIAELAKSKGALTVGVVTKPFEFEAEFKIQTADSGITEMQKHCDAVITIPNQRLFEQLPEDTTWEEATNKSNDVLATATKAITDIIQNTGDMNIDFADARTVMTDSGTAFIGIGQASNASEAVMQAIESPLLENQLKGAKGILYNIQASKSLSLKDLAEISTTIKRYTDPTAKVKFGTSLDSSLGDQVIITLIATSLNTENRGGYREGAGRKSKVTDESM